MEQSIILRAAESHRVDYDWGHLTWFCSGELGNSTDLTVGQCVLYPGHGNPPHHHPNSGEVLTVIEGRIRHTVEDGQEVEMGAGDTITLPPGLPHRAVNIGETDAVLFVVFPTANRQVQGE